MSGLAVAPPYHGRTQGGDECRQARLAGLYKISTYLLGSVQYVLSMPSRRMSSLSCFNMEGAFLYLDGIDLSNSPSLKGITCQNL